MLKNIYEYLKDLPKIPGELDEVITERNYFISYCD